MAQKTRNPATEVAVASWDAGWKTLYKVGAIAPLIALAFYLIQTIVIVFGEPFPATTESWFSLLQRNSLLGLLYLNALDIFSMTLLGIMFLALYVALRDTSRSTMLIATYLALAGVVVFVVPRVAMLSVFPLSDLYAATTTDVQREMLLAAGEALAALGTATPQTAGFLFMAVAGAIISVTIIRTGVFSKSSAYVGILAFVVTLANDISLIVAPSVAGILMPINGLLWLTWWIMMSWQLFRLAGRNQEAQN